MIPLLGASVNGMGDDDILTAGRNLAPSIVKLGIELDDQAAAPPKEAGSLPVGPVGQRELRLVLAALTLALILGALDNSIVNTALPRISSELGGLDHIAWVVTAFMLTSTIATPLYGKLCDMYGHRRVFVFCVVLFLLASGLCGVAQTMSQLILFRAFQGLGAGGLITLAHTIIGDLVGARERGRYQGLFTSAVAGGNLAGPLIGGLLTTALSWRWVFYVNLPIGGLALFLILIGLKHVPPLRAHRIDVRGALLLTVATTTLLLLTTWGGTNFPWLSAPSIAMAVASTILFLAFGRQELRAPEPMIDPRLFDNVSVAVGVTATATMAFAMMGTLVFMPLYLQLVKGLSPTAAGLMLFPQIAAMIFTSVVGGRWSSHIGRVKPFLLFGVAIEAVALGLIGVLAAARAPVVTLAPVLALLGLGMGMAMPNAIVIVQNSANRTQMGMATAMVSFARSLGGTLGVAVSGALIAARLKSSGQATALRGIADGGLRYLATMTPQVRDGVVIAYSRALSFSFFASCVVMVVALGIVSRLPDDRRVDRQGS